MLVTLLIVVAIALVLYMLFRPTRAVPAEETTEEDAATVCGWCDLTEREIDNTKRDLAAYCMTRKVCGKDVVLAWAAKNLVRAADGIGVNTPFMADFLCHVSGECARVLAQQASDAAKVAAALNENQEE